MSNRRELSKATKESKKSKSVSKPKDKIYDPMGQWAHPGEITRIPGGNITMQGVPYPVYAVPQFGEPTVMYPGMDYNFPESEYVDEYPLVHAQEGTTVSPSFEDRARATSDFFYSNPIRGLKLHKLKELPHQKQRPRLESNQKALIPGVTTLSESEYELVQMPEEYQGFPIYTTKTGNYFTLDPEYNKEYISPYIQKRFFGKDRTFYLPNSYLDKAQFQSGGAADTDYISVNPLSVFGATPGLYTEGYQRPTLDVTLGRRNMFPDLAKRSALEAVSGTLTTSLPYQNNTGLGVHGNLKLVGDRWKNVEDMAKANVEVDLGAGYDPNMGPYAKLTGSPQFTFGNVQPTIEKTYKGNLRAGEWLGKLGPYGGLSFTPGRAQEEERTSIGFGGRGNFAVGIGGGKTLGASGYYGIDPFGQASGQYEQSGLKGRTNYGFDVNLTIPFGTKQKQNVKDTFQNLFSSNQSLDSYRPMFMQEGGESFELELTDEEIEEYRKGGYIVEELPKAQQGVTKIDPSKARGRMSLLEKYEGDPTLFIPKTEVSESTQPKVVNRQVQNNAKKAVTETKQAVDTGAQMAMQAPHLTPEQKYDIATDPQKAKDFYNTQVTFQENQGSIERKKEQTSLDRALDYMTNPGDALYYMMRGETMPENYLEMKRAGIDPINDYYNAFGPSGGNTVLRGLDAALNPSEAAEAVYDISKGDYGNALMNLAMIAPAAKSFKYFDNITSLAKKTPLNKIPSPVKSRPSQWDNVYIPPEQAGFNPFRTFKSTYNKVATGNSKLPFAWKMEKIDDVTPALKNKYALSDEEAYVLGRYIDTPYNIQRGSKESDIFDKMIERNPAILKDNNLPVTKILDHSTQRGKDFVPKKRGETFSFPGNRSWSLGTADRFSNTGRTRLVIPSKYTKDLGFMAVPYDDSRLLKGINAFDNQQLQQARDLLKSADSAKEIARLEKHISELESLTSRSVLDRFGDEYEIIGNIPEGFKIIGKSNEGGFENIFIKPNYQTGGSIEAELTPEEIQWYLDNGYNVDYL